MTIEQENIDLTQKLLPPAYGGTVRDLIEASMSENTKRAYASRVKMFASWCAKNGTLPHFPTSPFLLSNYIAALIDNNKTIATIEQTLAAISFWHKLYRHEDPTKNELVRSTLKGAKRMIGTAAHKKQAIRIPVLKAIISKIDRGTAIGSRDAALILLGFSGAFRRSELVALNVVDLSPTVTTDGRAAYEITVHKSKTDQEAIGMIKGIFSATDKELCPVFAIREYLSFCEIREIPLFVRIRKGGRISHDQRLCGQSVARIIQRRAQNAGIELDVSGHSLRSGFITSAAEAGRTERSIQNQTGHKSIITLRSYIQRINILQDNAADGLI